MRRIFWLDTLRSQARALIRVSGRDAFRFVQGMITADVRALQPEHGVPAAFLTVKGKMISDAVLLDLAAPGSEDRVFGLAVPRELVDTLVEKLSKHAIMDEVEIQSDNDLAFVLVAGDSRPEISANLRLSRVEYPISGWLIWGTNTELAALFEAPHEDATDMFCAMRIDENQPAWGYEVRGDIFPPEAGFVAAVSYEKGCYLGQEPLARIHARGQTNWVMAKVRALDGEPTTCELATADRPKAGTVTTVAASQTDRLALAIVHRKVAQAGQILFCSDAPEQRWEIVVAPIGADVRPAKA